MRAAGLAVILLGAPLCIGPAGAEEARPPVAEQPSDATEQALLQRLSAGNQLLRAGQPRRAIDEHFDAIIATYEERHRDTRATIYAASGPKVVAYMLYAAGQGQDAIAVSETWSVALFLKGYALVEMKDHAAARASFEKARDLSPFNPHILNELANTYKAQRNWDLALSTYQAAKEHATAFSEEGQKDRNILVADHGIAYVYSETGRLDEAEAIYKDCLRRYPQDAYAKHELGYIEHLRRKGGRP